jgi:hypothetical protein
MGDRLPPQRGARKPNASTLFAIIGPQRARLTPARGPRRALQCSHMATRLHLTPQALANWLALLALLALGVVWPV